MTTNAFKSCKWLKCNLASCAAPSPDTHIASGDSELGAHPDCMPCFSFCRDESEGPYTTGTKSSFHLSNSGGNTTTLVKLLYCKPEERSLHFYFGTFSPTQIKPSLRFTKVVHFFSLINELPDHSKVLSAVTFALVLNLTKRLEEIFWLRDFGLKESCYNIIYIVGFALIY